MSRSYRNTLGNGSCLIRHKLCLADHKSLKLWKQLCNRQQRRRNNRCLEAIDDADDDYTFIVHYKKCSFGDDWGGPHDGYNYYEPNSYQNYTK